jgi:hypothetical protein
MRGGAGGYTARRRDHRHNQAVEVQAADAVASELSFLEAIDYIETVGVAKGRCLWRTLQRAAASFSSPCRTVG